MARNEFGWKIMPPLASYEDRDPTLSGTRQATWRDADGVGMRVVVCPDGAVLLSIAFKWFKFERAQVQELRTFLGLASAGAAAFPAAEEGAR
jgi:hypothetical protein